jgi:hypothetical protein
MGNRKIIFANEVFSMIIVRLICGVTLVGRFFPEFRLAKSVFYYSLQPTLLHRDSKNDN